MINPRSPIVAQMIGGYQAGYPPNYAQIGYNGYNGNMGYTGYYGNQVNYNYYNPIYQQNMLLKQREEEAKRKREEIEYKKRMSRIAHSYDGSKISDEQLSKLYEPQAAATPKQAADNYEFDSISRLVQNGKDAGVNPAMLQQAEKIKKYNDSVVKPDCNLSEFLNNAGTLYVNALMKDEAARNRNLSGTYDSNAYRQALGMRNAPYAGVFSNNIDDNIVTLPESIRNRAAESYESRRAAFIASITGGNRNG